MPKPRRFIAMKNRAELAHIRQLCSLGLGGAVIMPALLKAIRQVVASDSAGFFWADPGGELTHMYVERMLPPERIRRYFERHYDSTDHAFRTRLLARMAQRDYVGETLVDAALERTPYYQEVLQALDVHRILFAIVHDADLPLGQISLYRSERAPPFCADDRESLATIARYVAVGVKAPQLADPGHGVDAFRDSDEAALIVFTPAGEVVAAPHRGYALLAHASGLPVNRATLLGGDIERAGRTLLAELAARIPNDATGMQVAPARTVSNTWGHFRLHAYALGAGQLGVLIQRQEPFLVRLVDAMRALPLSPQQRETALLLAQDKSNAEVAAAMGVSPNTASYHVRQLFQKLDAHDRNQALARILDAGAVRRS